MILIFENFRKPQYLNKYTGGLERVARKYFEILKKKYDVRLYVNADSEQELFDSDPNIVPIPKYVCDSKRLSDFHYFANSEILKNKPELSIFNFPNSAHGYGINSKYPCWIIVHSLPDACGIYWKDQALKIAKWRKTSNSHRLVFVSEFCRKEYGKIFDVSDSDVLLNTFSNEHLFSDKIENRIAMLSRLDRFKRIEKAIKVSENLKIPLHLFHPSVLEKDMTYYEELKNKTEIVFHDNLPRDLLLKELSCSRFNIVPNHRETFSLVAYEAFCNGVPNIIVGNQKADHASKEFLDENSAIFLSSYLKKEEIKNILAFDGSLENRKRIYDSSLLYSDELWLENFTAIKENRYEI